jgi:rod shape-determining protein MreC
MALTLLGATGLAAVDRAAAPLQDAAERALSPIQRVLASAAGGVDAVTLRGRDIQTLQQRLDELSAQKNNLEVENLKVHDLTHENETLRGLLDFARQRVDLDLRGASLVGRSIAEEPGNLLRTIKIDLGSRDGVSPGMPVANDRGLIGRVLRTGSTWCDVLLITDPSSAVQARVERSRASGVAVGSTTGELVMRFVPQDRDGQPNVVPGDIVFTSGMSQAFPPMIPIGQVVDVHQSDVQTHQEAVIRPTVDFTALEFVLVVTGVEETAGDGGP